MKHKFLTLAFFLYSLTLYAQIPKGVKTHIVYDTIKKITEHIDFSPDTIPVYFEELVFASSKYERRDTCGYVIWQTYRKSSSTYITSYGYSVGFNSSGSIPAESYYKIDYEPTQFTKDVFLYNDRKTLVKNRIYYTIKK